LPGEQIATVEMIMYRLENEFCPTANNAFAAAPAAAPNPPLSDLTQYINPHVRNTRVQNAIGNHIQGFQRKPSKPDTYKTVMCQAWLESMKCTFGENCKFAHGEQELRPAKTQIRNHLKYKTKLCEKYTTSGICPYGSRCLFIHPAPTNQVKPETAAGLVVSENIAPMNVVAPIIAPSIENQLSPTGSPLQSIWSSNPNLLNVQTRQAPFAKSGPQRLPIRTAVVGSPLQGAAASDILDSSLMFNQTAEAMVSFLWA